MTKTQHSKATPRWGTPEDLVERAHHVMGGIDLDPCSEAKFQEVVQAATYYSLDERGEDGLVLPWKGRVFCNPPGGSVRQFWRRAMEQPIEQMIWVGFSVEQLCVLAGEEKHPADFSICFLRRRIDFERHDGYHGSPSHSNYIVGVNVYRDAFAANFFDLGKVMHGPLVGA